MAFFSMIFVVLLGIISIIGIILCIIGLILLIIFLAKRKTKKKKGFLIAAIILLVIGIPLTITLPGFITIANNAAINDHVNPKIYPVTNAIVKHDNNKLKELLEKGANPNEVFEGYPALFTACSNFDHGVNYEAAKILISYKADINAKADNQLSLMKDILTGTKRYNDQSEIYNIVKLLIRNGYNVNETDSTGVTLLMYAAVDSTYDVGYTLPYNLTDLFIKDGANVMATDNKGRTVLMWACGSIKNTADIKTNISGIPNIEGKNQFAPFDYKIIKYLIERGADVNANDNQGYKALDYFKLTEDNSRLWGQYDTVGKTEDYINKCKSIEELLQN